MSTEEIKAEYELMLVRLEAHCQQFPEHRPKVLAVFADVGRMMAYTIAIQNMSQYFATLCQPFQIVREHERLIDKLNSLSANAKICTEELKVFAKSVDKECMSLAPKSKWKAGHNSALNRVISKSAYTTSRK